VKNQINQHWNKLQIKWKNLKLINNNVNKDFLIPIRGVAYKEGSAWDVTPPAFENFVIFEHQTGKKGLFQG
jgi:hypothetical protein